MNIVILDSLTYGDDVDLSIFDKFAKVTSYKTTEANQTQDRIKDAEIIITNKVVIDKEIMQNAPKLKLICVGATGMNNIDLEYAKKSNIEVKNVAGYSTNSVVEHTLSMLFYLVSHSRYFDEYVKSKQWCKSEIFTHLGRSFYEISGKTWGIIGLGEIGRKMAKTALCLGADVQYYSTSGKNRDNKEYRNVELEHLLKTSDIVSIHAPLNENTKNLINRDNLKLLKDKAVLINVGRGGIVNEADLADELNKRDIYAGLDVLSNEPIKENHPLFNVKRAENLYITPHIAWTSIEARQRLIELIAKNIEEFLNV